MIQTVQLMHRLVVKADMNSAGHGKCFLADPTHLYSWFIYRGVD